MEKGGTLSSLPSLTSFSKCAEGFRRHCWKEDPGPVGPAGLMHCGCIPGPGRRHDRGAASCWAPACGAVSPCVWLPVVASKVR